MEIGKQIQKIRKENNLSQEQFGKRFHVTRQTVSNWENEKSYPDLQTLISISEEFDISLDKLLKDTPKMVEDFDSAVAGRRRTKRTIIILVALIVLTPILWFIQFWIRLEYAYQPTAYEKRNRTETAARMYVNLQNQTPSDAIVYTYDKQEYDSFSERKREKVFDKVNGNMEGDIPALRFDQGETIVRFTLQDGVSYNLIPKENPKLRIYQQATNLNEVQEKFFTYESQLLKDEEGYYYDFANVEFIDSDEYPTIYMEIEYAYGEEAEEKATSVTALCLIKEQRIRSK